MKYIKNFYHNKLIYLILIISIMLIIFYFSKSNLKKQQINTDNYQLVLFGNNEVTIYQDEEYKEIGYYALLNNQDVTKQVIVNNSVDTSKIGTYKITYNINNIIKTRII